MIRTLQERRSSLNSQSLDLTRGALGMGPNRQELTNRERLAASASAPSPLALAWK